MTKEKSNIRPKRSLAELHSDKIAERAYLPRDAKPHFGHGPRHPGPRFRSEYKIEDR